MAKKISLPQRLLRGVLRWSVGVAVSPEVARLSARDRNDLGLR